MFKFRFSFYPRIWNTLSLVARFISGTPFNLQTSTEKTKPKKTYEQNPTFHFSHATETTVVLKNLKNTILLLLGSVPGKIWPNQMYTEMLYCTVTLFHQQEPFHELLPTRSCSSLALCFLPVTTQSHCSSLFHVQEGGTTLPRASHSLVQDAIPLFMKLQGLLQFLSWISSLVLPTEWASNACLHYQEGTLLHTLGNQQPAAAKNRIFWTPELHLPSHTIVSTNISTKKNKQRCSLKQELFRSFPALQLQNFTSTEEIT